MAEYKIYFDESSFVEVVKRKTYNLKDNLLHEYSLYDYATVNSDNLEYFWFNLKKELKQVNNKTDKSIFLSELLVYLGEKRDIIINDFESSSETLQLIDELVHFLFRELEKLNVGVDRNAFTTTEIKTLTFKINKIIVQLDKINIGQEIIFDRIEELKQDYKDILVSFGLGKKPFFQRFAGIMVGYIGEKGADEVLHHIKPYIKDVIKNVPKLIS